MKYFKPGFLLLMGACLSFSAFAGDEFKENAHYKRVVEFNADENNKAGKIEIIEFFLYSCKHCYELEPKLANWLEKNKDKASFKRVPAVVTPAWVTLAKAYYVAEKLNVLDKSHDELFKSIHEDKEVYLNEYKLSKFFERYGIKANDFIREFNSKDVVDKVSKARRMTVKYAFRGVPAVVVNDEYKTAPFYTRNQEQMLDVMDYLLAKTAVE